MMYVSLQVISNFADSIQVIASRYRIIPALIQATVIPSLELVEDTPIRPSEGHKSGYMNMHFLTKCEIDRATSQWTHK